MRNVWEMPKRKSTNFLQGSDSSQNNGKERTAWDNMGTRKFTISAKSHGFNPVDYIFQIVRMKLHQDALEKKIMYENLEKIWQKVFQPEWRTYWNPHLLMLLPKLLIQLIEGNWLDHKLRGAENKTLSLFNSTLFKSMNQLVFYSERHTRGRSTGRDTVAVLFFFWYFRSYIWIIWVLYINNIWSFENALSRFTVNITIHFTIYFSIILP